jgi:hypothetical protein
MKKSLSVLMIFFVNFALASEKCKKEAEEIVEIREIYKNYQQLANEVNTSLMLLEGVDGGAAAERRLELIVQKVNGEIAFFHMGGTKGAKLYKRYYSECIAEEKEEKELAARKAASEAAKSKRQAN